MAGTQGEGRHWVMVPLFLSHLAAAGVLFAALFLSASPAASQEEQLNEEYVTGSDGVEVPVVAGEVIVKIENGADLNQPPTTVLRDQFEATSVVPIDPLGQYYLVRSNRSTCDMLSALPSAPFARSWSIEPNVIYQTVDVGVSEKGKRWALDDIDAQGAWNHFERADGILIGVIDTGLYSSFSGVIHPDLQAAIWRARRAV